MTSLPVRDHDWPDWPDWPAGSAGSDVRVRMGLHTGEPQLGDEGYLRLDVVRARRISAAGHGGQILISETTRALLGNQVPDGVAVHDLGEQHLKDIQHERIYEISIDGAPVGSKPLKTAAPPDTMESRLEDRINAYVERQIEHALGDSGEAKSPTRAAAGGVDVLVVLAVAIVVILLLVRLVL